MMRSTFVVALVVAVVAVQADVAHAQEQTSPLHLTSLEWLVADANVMVRGVVVDVAGDQTWNLVTLDVLETLKGTAGQRLKFAVHKFDTGDAALAKAKQSRREMVWILKRNVGAPGEAPDRERVMARHKIDLHAPFLPGRPGAPSLPALPLGPAEIEATFLTIDLQVPKTGDELIKEIRIALKVTKPARSHSIALPQEIAQRTGFSRAQNLLTVPVDGRFEELARRLVLSPGGFLTKDDADARKFLRLEGVKSLRMFPSEQNLALVRAWLDDPLSTLPLKGKASLVPAGQQAEPKMVLPRELAEVPEIHFQEPLTKAMEIPEAQLHTAVTIDGVHLLNQRKIDAFIEELKSKRSDLAGLSFTMGDACRMKPEASKKFVAALDVFRKAEPSTSGFSSGIPPSPAQAEELLMKRYRDQLKECKIDPSASVASLMQVLGHEGSTARLALAQYLDTLAIADATHALARLAIFSAEAEIRTAAVNSLKKRDRKDYTDILLAGLMYPWPAVAERASEALAKLERKDLVPQLINVLDTPDPRAPQRQELDGKKVTVVRELVRINHHHNCLLCHAPVPAPGTNASKKEDALLEGLSAQIPVPSEPMVAYYRPSVPDILVRFDVTYLRQDFSMKFRVADASPWPEMQRYDFLVRTRAVSAQDAVALQNQLQPTPENAVSPYHRAAVAALRELTGLDAEPTASAWRQLTRQ